MDYLLGIGGADGVINARSSLDDSMENTPNNIAINTLFRRARLLMVARAPATAKNVAGAILPRHRGRLRSRYYSVAEEVTV